MMNKHLSNLIVFLLLVTAMMMFAGAMQPLYAQPDPCPNPPCDGDVPISGIEWLLVSGGVFGARKIYQKIRRQ